MEEELSSEMRQMLVDSVNVEDMVEYLDVTTEDIVDMFEDRVLEKLEAICEVARINTKEDEEGV